MNTEHRKNTGQIPCTINGVDQTIEFIHSEEPDLSTYKFVENNMILLTRLNSISLKHAELLQEYKELIDEFKKYFAKYPLRG